MTVQDMDTDGKVIVPAVEDMPEEHFYLHMQNRHEENIGGEGGLAPVHQSDYVYRCWLAFHNQLHRLGLQRDIDHDHRPARRVDG